LSVGVLSNCYAALYCVHLRRTACCLLQAKQPGWPAVHAELFQLLGNHPDKALTQVTATAGKQHSTGSDCQPVTSSNNIVSRHNDQWMQSTAGYDKQGDM
jgi:hypothetical protein